MPHGLRALIEPAWIACVPLALLAGCGLDDFTERSAPYADAPPARVERGRQLLAQYQCGSCHAIPEVPIARADVGPPLTAFGRRSYIAGHLPNGPDLLTRWIVSPSSLVPDTTMPSMGVSAEDARDMAAYLLSLE
ncbi:Cytochrome C [Burkholderiales bacterium 8X]|nr:Cytochrome C [Burkholderiales bacterium 8X]